MHKEIEKMLDHCAEYASDLLIEMGEAYPFGAFIDTIGNVHPLEMEVDKKNLPNIGQVINGLEKYCKAEMEAERMKGYALSFEVAVELSENEMQDCIAIQIHHKEETCPTFYLPFKKDGEKTIVEELFAVKG